MLRRYLAPTSKALSSPASIGLTARQLDPLEARCDEIRNFLYDAEPVVGKDDINSYITRAIVVRCGELFGRHMSRNLPILHLPTFRLTETSVILALAVVLGGACYDTRLIPSQTITKFAKALLVLVARQTVCYPKPKISRLIRKIFSSDSL
jgi:hypothetical protein